LGKVRALSGRKACRILKEHGFREVRRKGSHIVMQKRVGGTTYTVVVPNHQELRKGTLSSIIRQSGLPKSAFES
jgi:predicted RNA binding protein YcfA (HicA-like mRNA interferase family)